MPLISEWKPSDPIQVLVFGKFKLGKSWGAFTFPRPVVFDFDDGVKTARNPAFVKKYGMQWMFYETFTDPDRNKQGIVTRHTGFDESCRFFDEWMKPQGKWKGYATGREMFDTFIIDSGTTLSDLCMAKAAIVLGAQKLSKTQESALATGLLIPKKQDYGSERSLLEQFVRMVKDSGKNVVLVCHEKELIDDTTQGVTDIVPLLTGKSATLVPLIFDEVYNLRVRLKGMEVVRYLQTQPGSLVRCGTRYGIANESPWEYQSLRAQIEAIHKQQQVASVATVGAVVPAGTLTTQVK